MNHGLYPFGPDNAQNGLAPGRQGGFTLIELLVVLSIMAIALGVASLSLRDGAQDILQREAQRLSAQLESARAQSRASGVQVRWLASANGYRFEGLWKPEALLIGPGSTAATVTEGDGGTEQVNGIRTGAGASDSYKIGVQWLSSATQVSPNELLLGPEPVLPAQSLVLSNQGQQIRVGSNGIGPFAIQDSSLTSP